MSHLQQSLPSVLLAVRHWPPGIANKGCEGILSNYDYDKAGQLRLENRRQTSGLTLIHSNYFTYDAAGNRTVWQRVESGVDEATYYTCNDADELTHHMKDDVYTYFTYDNDGNQTSKKVGESLCYYNYDADTRRGRRPHMLTSFTDGATDADYVYDAFPGIRRRVRSAVDGTVTYYAFDGPNVLTDYDSDVSAERSYVVPFLDDSLVLRTGGADYDYALDGLGSVYSLVDGDESVQNDYLYEAFGSTHGTPTQNLTNRLRFTGREWDTAASLGWHRRRIADYSLGRFLSHEPGDRSGFLRYVYADSSPANLVDPSGRWAKSTHIYPWNPKPGPGYTLRHVMRVEVHTCNIFGGGARSMGEPPKLPVEAPGEENEVTTTYRWIPSERSFMIPERGGWKVVSRPRTVLDEKKDMSDSVRRFSKLLGSKVTRKQVTIYRWVCPLHVKMGKALKKAGRSAKEAVDTFTGYVDEGCRQFIKGIMPPGMGKWLGQVF